jgi:hypothetical protein
MSKITNKQSQPLLLLIIVLETKMKMTNAKKHEENLSVVDSIVFAVFFEIN